LLTRLEPLERLAAPVPLPRWHRHRYHGVLASNSAPRAAVTALAWEPSATPEPPAAAEPVACDRRWSASGMGAALL